MTPEEINKAIAEECGWKRIRPCIDSPSGMVGYAPSDPFPHDKGEQNVPNYFADLNACAEMEETLDVDIADPGSPRYAYSRILYSIVSAEQQPCRAKAPQRCEAFLLLKGKFK